MELRAPISFMMWCVCMCACVCMCVYGAQGSHCVRNVERVLKWVNTALVSLSC
jgi:hypothetical protein